MMLRESIETKVAVLMGLTLFTVSLGGIAEIFPMIFESSKTQPIEGLRPYTALQLEGRDIYVREGCTVCHTQMVRTLRFETARYGHYSVAGEDVYEHPFLWGTKRTGPDLARVGGRYSDDWHRRHLLDPRQLVPASNMPAYPWLFEQTVDGSQTAAKMRALATLGVPYTDAEVDAAFEQVDGVLESDALIAYMQSLGTDIGNLQTPEETP